MIEVANHLMKQFFQQVCHTLSATMTVLCLFTRGGVEDAKPKAKDTKKKSEARPRTALRRTDHLEAKDGNARSQGPRTLAQVFSITKRSSKKLLLVLELCSRSVYVQAYADDLAVLFTGADMVWIRGTVWPRMQQILLQTGLWNKSYSLAARKPTLYGSLTNGILIRVPCQ